MYKTQQVFVAVQQHDAQRPQRLPVRGLEVSLQHLFVALLVCWERPDVPLVVYVVQPRQHLARRPRHLHLGEHRSEELVELGPDVHLQAPGLVAVLGLNLEDAARVGGDFLEVVLPSRRALLGLVPHGNMLECLAMHRERGVRGGFDRAILQPGDRAERRRAVVPLR